MRHFRRTVVALGGLLLIVSFSTAGLGASITFGETNLTSDGGPNVPSAANTDPNLKNPWGIAFANTSPFWLADQNNGLSTLYNSAGAAQSTVVTVPGGSPTGVVNNGTSNFLLTNGNGAVPNFIFDTLTGNIVGWNSASGAVNQASVSGASFTGLALANNGTQNQLYAADNATGTGHATIDVFGPSYQLVGTLTDPNLASTFRPYNIQAVTINGVVTLVVTFQGSGGAGAIDEYNPITGTWSGHPSMDSHLSNPWGVANTLAPAAFGQFAGDLLIGNRSGQINAFDPNTLAQIGTLDNAIGQPLVIPGGLWGIAFRSATSGNGFDPNALYFATGINGAGNLYSDGLFGEITVVPEPSSAILLGLGLIVLCGLYTWGVRSAGRKNSLALAGGHDRR